jgi:hypothetical protein
MHLQFHFVNLNAPINYNFETVQIKEINKTYLLMLGVKTVWSISLSILCNVYYLKCFKLNKVRKSCDIYYQFKEALKGYIQQQQYIFIPEEYYNYSALSWDESTIWNSNKIFFFKFIK